MSTAGRSTTRGLGFLLSLVVAHAAPAAAADAAPALDVASDPEDELDETILLPAEGPPTPYELATAGEAWRLATRRGPIRVWAPNGYDPATAATVIYVHGYFIGVDAAWTEHRLPEQFAASHLNALFIVCGAPEGPREPVTWPSLSGLLEVVARGVSAPLPAGRAVAIGHSGAHRTLETWLGSPRLGTLVLVDAAYGPLSPYRSWLRRSKTRRLLHVASDTRWRTDRFHRSLPGTRVLEGLPPPEAGTLPDDARDARILYIRTSRDHMELVTGGVTLPLLLRALRAPLIGDQPRSVPLVPLAPPPTIDPRRDASAS